MDRSNVFRIESKMLLLANEYIDKIELMRLHVSRLSVRKCFATKGKNMGFRGMFSPSLALKYLVGNAAPGRLLKGHPHKLKGHYMYEFDEHDRIIYAKKFSDANEADLSSLEEFIFYHESDQISIVFQGDTADPHTITLCEFCEKLPITYSQLRQIPSGNCHLLEIEQYEYSQRRLSLIAWYVLSQNEKKEYEGGGYISKISIDNLGNEVVSEVHPQLFGF